MPRAFLNPGPFLRRLYERERAQYLFLPDASLMEAVGYYESLIGTYRFLGEDTTEYKVQLLSQTSMALLELNGKFVDGQVVRSYEELIRFLHKNNFPLPA